MSTHSKIAMSLVATAVLLGVGGAVAAAHPDLHQSPQSPVQVGPVDLPEPGDVPDLPGQ